MTRAFKQWPPVDGATIYWIKGLIQLINRLKMDHLAPLLRHFSPSANCYFSGVTCEGGGYDGTEVIGHLHLVRSGALDVDISGHPRLQIQSPSVVVMPRPCAHRLTPGPQGVELICGQIDLGLREQNPLLLALPKVFVIPLAEMPSIAATLELLYQEAFNEDIGKATALSRLLEYFLLQVLRHLLEHGELHNGALAVMADSRMALAMQAMHDHPSRPWTLELLADVAHMSRARFAARFHQLAGTPPLEYLTQWRLSVARGLLLKGQPMKTVAAAVGYSSPEAFGRAFVRKLGQSPSEWTQSNV